VTFSEDVTMSLFSAGLLSITRRFAGALTSRAAICSSSSSSSSSIIPKTTPLSPSPSLLASSASTSFSGIRSLSSLTSSFAAKSVQAPIISGLQLPQSSGFLSTPLTTALTSEWKRFGHPSKFKACAKKRREKFSFHKRSQTPGGRAVLWRRIIARKPKLAN